MESRHSWHTGRREMVKRGIPQSLQSEGKKTEKMLRAALNNGATKSTRCLARSLRRCRSKVARLLKTTLQSMVPADPERAHPPPWARKHRGHQYSNFRPVLQC